MKKQFIVGAHGYLERALFYEYIHKKYKIKNLYFDKEYMCHSNFPFVIDFKKKFISVLESITCCAMAAQNKKIVSIEEFKECV